MSTSKILGSVSECFDFTKSKVVENVVQYIRENKINVDTRQMEGLTNIINSSISQAFTISCGNIEKEVIKAAKK